MSIWFKKFYLSTILTFFLLNGFGQSNTAIDNKPEVAEYYNKSIAQVLIQPDVTRFIGGYSHLDRKKYLIYVIMEVISIYEFLTKYILS